VLFGRTWAAEFRSFSLESRVPDGVVTNLERRDHRSRWGGFDDSRGHAAAIRLHEDGILEGDADPRGDGATPGYRTLNYESERWDVFG
jgi:gamma-glutamyltranspeptidase/glutathione hydrolase